MESIVFTVSNKEDGLASINYICEAIKGREDANHKLFFSRRLMGMYTIFNAEDREIIFCPIGIVDKLEGKNIVDLKPCMWYVGESDLKKGRLNAIIDWVLNKGGVLLNPDS